MAPHDDIALQLNTDDMEQMADAKKLYCQTVQSVHHWTDGLFTITTDRPQGFRFRSGEFVMIGLPVDGKPLLRAYSVASPSWHEELEFFSIKVQDGPLTSRLQHIKPGDKMFINKKPTGTLVNDALIAGKRLFLLSTGTGLAPFLSVIRDPETYEKFDQVILTHTVRTVAELAYKDFLEKEIYEDEILAELIGDKLTYYPSVTREPFTREGRITDLIRSGQLADDLGIENPFDPAEARVMLCGSMAFNKELAAMLEEFGLEEGSNAAPNTYVLERAFVG